MIYLVLHTIANTIFLEKLFIFTITWMWVSNVNKLQIVISLIKINQLMSSINYAETRV